MRLGFRKENDELRGSATSRARLHGAGSPNGSTKTEHPTPIDVLSRIMKFSRSEKGASSYHHTLPASKKQLSVHPSTTSCPLGIVSLMSRYSRVKQKPVISSECVKIVTTQGSTTPKMKEVLPWQGSIRKITRNPNVQVV